ncbi:MAG TPA: N-6 DNA methylase [Gemmatimonadales bacterium]|nr:N-6 DNA methylase [Gemmatimonadales bacterium]
MDVENSLRSIHLLSDLPRLVATLGHQPLWEEVPDEAWNRGAHRILKVWAVGRTRELPWFAVESRAPERDAAALAGRISRRGGVGMVLALDPEVRRLAVALGFERLPSIALDLTQPDPEAIASLGKLAGLPDGGTLAFAAKAADALSAEPVGRRFFREFRATLDRLAAGLPGPMPADDRHSLALLQLTRVLFLYFIQTKGWLGGERFLSEQVDRCLDRGRKIHRDLLRPLFFGTLNRPMGSRSRIATGFGPIPFLNGGLFEPHPLERRFRADIPNGLWLDAFEQLFERFHFTVAERNCAGLVAPDMLGRVFEGVMAPEARRASGTFYTPSTLVQKILEAALTALVASRLGCRESEAERRIADADAATVQVLSSITLLDPAVGSGAFLLGALERLSTAAAGRSDSALVKRRVLQHNLFGVDRSAAAVRLTELRLWLAVIAEDPAERAEAVSPLPNLDCLIRQGDSLFDPIGLTRTSIQGAGGLADELCRLRREVVTASGSSKQALLRRLRTHEARALGATLATAEAGYRSDISECVLQARTNDLFGHRRGMDRELHCRLVELRSRLRQLRQAGRRLARDGDVPWFHYQSHFADVFARGGFDLVIGNPPWLRSEAIPADLRARLAGRYRWWRATGRGYGNGPDLAVAFVERGVELAGTGGVMAMLVPAKIATARYGAAARHELASKTTLHAVADLTRGSGSEFDATVYPMAVVASRTMPKPGHRVRTTLALTGESGPRQTELRGGGPWILLGERVGRVLAFMEGEHPRLSDTMVCHLGVKTGLNRVFLNPPIDLEPELLRWAVRGRDLQPFGCKRRVRLLWTHDPAGHVRRELPPRARTYLGPYEAELRARRDYQGGPWWALFRTRPAVARYRVAWSDLARTLVAAPLITSTDLELVPLNTCYVVAVPSADRALALAAWLNSTWLRVAARAVAVPASGGYARFNADVVARLPLPLGALGDADLIRLSRAGCAGTEVQAEIDAVVAGHLSLSSSAQRALRVLVDGTAGDRR